MHRALTEILRRARTIRSESGYVMVTVMGVLLVATLFSVAAISAAQNDTPSSRGDVDRKAAFAAAEAGLNYYQYRLNEDSNFWASCTNVEGPSATEPAPVNQPWTTGPDNRVWRNVPDSPDTQYTIELLPWTGSQCNPADPSGSMINPSNGTFRIRATGRSSAGRQGQWTYRSIVGTFRRRGFLDFLYFTDFETSPPTIYPSSSQAWAAANCNRYVRDGRLSLSGPNGVTCTNIQFAPNDVVNGPMHTNDQILVCGNPTFGRLTDGSGNPVTDAVEVSHDTSPGYRNSCTGAPNVRPSGNTLKWNTQR
jgi:Tfp pilus assembly protein PilX